MQKNVSRDRKKVGTSVKEHNFYLDDNDNGIYDHRNLIQKLLDYFNGDLIRFRSRGYLSWIDFEDHAMVIVTDAKD